MENAIIKLTEELADVYDDYSILKGDYARAIDNYRAVNNKMDRLVSIILENTKLNYTDSGLTIKEDDDILQYVKFIDPDTYAARLEELKKEAQERDNAAANIAENVKKEARKNGK